MKQLFCFSHINHLKIKCKTILLAFDQCSIYHWKKPLKFVNMAIKLSGKNKYYDSIKPLKKTLKDIKLNE